MYRKVYAMLRHVWVVQNHPEIYENEYIVENT
jgi:hypothetical protein